MRPLSKSKKDKIVNLLFSGKTYREIELTQNVSLGVISKVIREFIGVAEGSSITEAAAEYNVEEIVDRLLELAHEVRETGVSVPNLLSAVRLYSFMRARGLESSQLESYLKMCDRHKGDLANFASSATEFFLLEDRTGKSYDEVVENYSKLTEKRTELRRDVAELRKKKIDAGKDLERELATNNLVREEIPYACALKKTLISHGFTVENTFKIPKFLREIEARGGNAKVFIARAEEAKVLKWEILDLKDEKKSLQPVVESIREEGIKLQNARDELQNIVIPSLELKEKGLTDELERLEKRVKALTIEAEKRGKELRLVDCLTNVLKSKSSDVDALYSYVYWLKQIESGAAPHLISSKPYYEEEVRKRIINTLVEYLKEDLATRQEVTKLQKELKETNNVISTLSAKTTELERANEELQNQNTKLNLKVKELEKDLQKCQSRILSEPAIPPESKELPFNPMR